MNLKKKHSIKSKEFQYIYSECLLKLPQIYRKSNLRKVDLQKIQKEEENKVIS